MEAERPRDPIPVVVERPSARYSDLAGITAFSPVILRYYPPRLCCMIIAEARDPIPALGALLRSRGLTVFY
jgi:hypothetical protein